MFSVKHMLPILNLKMNDCIICGDGSIIISIIGDDDLIEKCYYIIQEKGIGIERKGIRIDFQLGKRIGNGIDFPTKKGIGIGIY